MPNRPLISFMVISYKQELFIRQVVRSVLTQTYEPLEIILSDNCSPDRTFEIIEEEAASYRGPHKLILNRNLENMGVSGNINKVWELAAGELLIAGAGDDIAYPHRAEALTANWLAGGKQADIVTCSQFDIVELDGRRSATRSTQIFMPNTDQHYSKWRCGVTGACAAYSRRIYAGTGALDPRIIAEDNVYPFWVWLRRGIVDVVQGSLLGKLATNNNLASVYASIESVPRRSDRKRIRIQAADDQLARSMEWLRFARSEKHERGVGVVEKLERLVRLRARQRECFDAPFVRVMQLAADTMISGMGVKHGMGMIVRACGVC